MRTNSRRCGLYLLGLCGFGSPVLAQDEPASTRTMTIELKKTLTIEERLGGCEARLAIEYWQKGDLADVRMVVTNEECGASHGEFLIRLMLRNDAGETIDEEFPETWSRDDDQPLSMARLYPIGDGVDLIRVRSRGLSCTCGTEAEDESGLED
jgi:hypothetical protein